ncbi:hypothetical protein AGLY_001720 [Aphis glycines]|uniref:Uncharacterized protein n=1 Tax=Aphis glycines TaxID=307491 RepID=A0A6G0U4I1_APHGL|nr:hypothetical protein AGLY_001720 [Aphis glycines]
MTHREQNALTVEFTLRGCQCTICFLSLAHAQHRQNAFTQNHFFYDFNNKKQSTLTAIFIYLFLNSAELISVIRKNRRYRLYLAKYNMLHHSIQRASVAQWLARSAVNRKVFIINATNSERKVKSKHYPTAFKNIEKNKKKETENGNFYAKPVFDQIDFLVTLIGGNSKTSYCINTLNLHHTISRRPLKHKPPYSPDTNHWKLYPRLTIDKSSSFIICISRHLAIVEDHFSIQFWSYHVCTYISNLSTSEYDTQKTIHAYEPKMADTYFS